MSGRKKQIRNGHRTHVKRLEGEINSVNPDDKIKVQALRNSLMDKVTIIQNLDNEVQ